MKKNKKKLILWVIFYIPVFLLSIMAFYYWFQYDQGYFERQKHIGKRFDLSNLMDIEGNRTVIKFSTDFTIVDFWFKGCGPCLEEMKQFETLISGLEKKLTMVSISIDDVRTWKPLFSECSIIPFLNKKVDNWNHYVLIDTTINQKDTIKKVRNGITIYSESSIRKMTGRDFIINEYGIHSFPGYLVLDKDGIVIESPLKVTDYIKEKFLNQHIVSPFLTEFIYNDKFIIVVIVSFIPYSIFYWLFIIIKMLKRKSAVTNKGEI